MGIDKELGTFVSLKKKKNTNFAHLYDVARNLACDVMAPYDKPGQISLSCTSYFSIKIHSKPQKKSR